MAAHEGTKERYWKSTIGKAGHLAESLGSQPNVPSVLAQ